MPRPTIPTTIPAWSGFCSRRNRPSTVLAAFAGARFIPETKTSISSQQGLSILPPPRHGSITPRFPASLRVLDLWVRGTTKSRRRRSFGRVFWRMLIAVRPLAEVLRARQESQIRPRMHCASAGCNKLFICMIFAGDAFRLADSPLVRRHSSTGQMQVSASAALDFVPPNAQVNTSKRHRLHD